MYRDPGCSLGLFQGSVCLSVAAMEHLPVCAMPYICTTLSSTTGAPVLHIVDVVYVQKFTYFIIIVFTQCYSQDGVTSTVHMSCSNALRES